MPQSLGAEIRNWACEESFLIGFSGLIAWPFGDHAVGVDSGIERRTLVWAETVKASRPIPQLIEFKNIIQ